MSYTTETLAASLRIAVLTLLSTLALSCGDKQKTVWQCTCLVHCNDGKQESHTVLGCRDEGQINNFIDDSKKECRIAEGVETCERQTCDCICANTEAICADDSAL